MRTMDRQARLWLRRRRMVRFVVVLAFVACAPAMPVRDVTPAGMNDGCTRESESLSCAHRTFELAVTKPWAQTRVVHVALPKGNAPSAGWPVVVLFQGSLFSAARTWSASKSDVAGAYWQTSAVAALLEAGFAVVTPEVRYFGVTFWDTNVPQWALAWDSAPDHHFMVALFEAIDSGALGPLDGSVSFAGGISSGGYMTSRMALSYPGRFRALAIHSASWATCGGPVCVLPEALPSPHPPTVFLHGVADAVVPIATMREYETRLKADGVAVESVVVAGKGHEWLEASVTPLVSFFSARR